MGHSGKDVGEGKFLILKFKVRMSTPEITKALMESVKHRKYGQKSDYYPFSSPASITMRLEGIQEPFKTKTK